MLRPNRDQPDHNSSPPADAEEDALIRKARRGDRYAFHCLVDRHQLGIFRMVYYRTRSKMDAEDLTQDIFLKAYQGLPRLKSVRRFRGWLYRIALNRVRDHYRKEKLRSLFRLRSLEEEFQEPMGESGLDTGPLQAALRRDFWRQMERITEKLSKKEREVFMLRFFDQLTIEEIAGVLDRGPSTVKTHLYRAIHKVKADKALIEMIEEFGHVKSQS